MRISDWSSDVCSSDLMPSRIDADGQGEAVHDETQRGLLGRIGSRIGKVRGPVPAALQTREALLLLRNYEESGRGWFWSTDAEGRLTYISEAVAALMGRRDRKSGV